MHTYIYIYVIQSIQSGLHYIDSTVYIVYIDRESEREKRREGGAGGGGGMNYNVP